MTQTHTATHIVRNYCRRTHIFTELHRSRDARIKSLAHSHSLKITKYWNCKMAQSPIIVQHLPRPIFNSSSTVFDLIVILSVAAATWAVVILAAAVIIVVTLVVITDVTICWPIWKIGASHCGCRSVIITIGCRTEASTSAPVCIIAITNATDWCAVRCARVRRHCV